MRFKSGLMFDLRPHYPADTVKRWRDLSGRFFDRLDHPTLVQLAVTDRFENAVGRWQRDEPEEFGGRGQAGYQASKADGTQAQARTVVLADRRAAVVVAANAADELDGEALWWLLTHETQHVLMHQSNAAAFAVQRRIDQAIWSPRPWEFVLTAQSAIDEFRAERATHADLPARELTYGPRDLQRLLGQLESARALSARDLDGSYQIVLQAVDRLANMAAYSAAAVDAGRDEERRWAGADELVATWALLRRLPAVGDPIDRVSLWEAALEVSETLDQLLREHGVELVKSDDEGGIELYFARP